MTYPLKLLPIIALGLAACSGADETPTTKTDRLGSLLVHPLFSEGFACQNHWEGQLPYPGDALGADCFVTQLVETEDGRSFSRLYMSDGMSNEDWFSWRKDVLAPVSGIVSRVTINEKTNAPGILGAPPASFIIIKRADGISVLVAHIREIEVTEGDQVEAGMTIAKVGNNGFGRNPHIHIGAISKQGKPMPVRFDLRAEGKLHKTD